MTQSPEPKRRGRPAVPADQRSDRLVQIRTTAARKAKLERLAASAGVSQAAWIEAQIDRAREPQTTPT